MNKFYISVTCDYEVLNEEWLDLLLELNRLLQTYKNGKYSNISANLEEIAVEG